MQFEMWTLSEFLTRLPGIKPMKARRLILEGGLLSADERKDIHLRDRSLIDAVLEVGPEAAIAILAAYQDGRLPMQKASLRPSLAADAEAYARSDELRKKAAERRRRRLAAKDPSLIVEGDFTDQRLMDSVFFANIGPGSGSMVLAGIAVHKAVHAYKSNSGKSTGWAVRFDWVGSDGQSRHSETMPPEADNRRNDPDRNWGLHE